MEVILTHSNADFDAVAAQVAASRLYPRAIRVRGRSVSRDVQRFISLHKDHFELATTAQVDWAAVTRVILVDVRRRSRLGDFKPLVERLGAPGGPEVHVYDHHPPAEDDVAAAVEVVAQVGCTVTLMVERLVERGITVDPSTATLMLLGVYTDTGSLTYPTTTARDARATAWLLEHGASLTMVRRYLKAPLAAGQRDVLNRLMAGVEIVDFGGVSVGLASVPLQAPVNGLSVVVTMACELRGLDALIAAFPHGRKRTLVIGRARVDYVDVGEVMLELGGGGHSGAGSAAVKPAPDEEALRRRILEVLERDPPRPKRVRDLMSSPVLTVEPERPLNEIEGLLERWGITGLPVVRGDEVLGVISIRDVRQAQASGRGALPVSSCMSHQPATTPPDAPLESALAQMVERDVGRLPVMDEGHLVGIVTRKDLLRVLYPQQV